MDTGDLELEMVELQFPSVFPVGTYVVVMQVINSGVRALPNKNMKGKTGVVNSHRSHHGIRWNRVSMDGGGAVDFQTQELQKYE